MTQHVKFHLEAPVAQTLHLGAPQAQAHSLSVSQRMNLRGLGWQEPLVALARGVASEGGAQSTWRCYPPSQKRRVCRLRR